MDSLPLIWLFDPVLISTLLTAGLVYALLAGPLRRKLTAGPGPTRAQMMLFGSGLLITFLSEASPLHDISERYLLSAHMIQHLLLSYVAAPLFIAGTPAWMMRPFLLNRYVAPVFRTLTRPLVAFLLFSLGFSLWHLPFIYEAALHSDFTHHFQHVIFLMLSLIMWWPVMSPLAEYPRLGRGLQVAYLVALPVGQFFASALLTFSAVAIYPTYIGAPRHLGLTPEADQQLGGIIMKVGGFVTFSIPLVVVFLRWSAESMHSSSGKSGADTIGSTR